ncbi:phage tail protein [uncultured Allobaculum sp.]|uniref:phage tail tube protein n=1 Tax=uncultured Allobaculum sp. TaxID=1187017 RepID=UPI002584AA75|nr:phage tail protein [uncultured Allobaculum sp.]
MSTTGNNAGNVSQGKPKVGGAIFRAASGTTLPKSAAEELNEAFKCLGYVSEDGVVNQSEIETSETKAWGGDTVLSSLTGKSDKFKLTLIESLNVEVLKLIYGDANVSGTLENGITVKATSEQPAEASYVIDMVLKNGVPKRVVIPSGTMSALDDITYSDSTPLGYGTEITATPDANGVTHYEYIGGTAV